MTTTVIGDPVGYTITGDPGAQTITGDPVAYTITGDPEGVDALHGAEASGTPVIAAVTAAGAQVVTGRAATGVVVIAPATASGGVDLSRAASGTPAIGTATAAGIADRILPASGTPIIVAATATGAATRLLTSAGAATIAAATATGTAGKAVSASGTVAVGAATANGLAAVNNVNIAAGSPAIAAASAAGTAEREVAASGAVSISPATAIGAAEREATANGAATIAAATASGLVEREAMASGTPAIAAATADGAVFVSAALSALQIQTGDYLLLQDGSRLLLQEAIAGTKIAFGSPSIVAVTAAGAAERLVLASGTPAIAAATATGTVEREMAATGAATIAAATATGTAAIAGVVTASGTPSITAATATGAAEREIIATGAPSIAAATATGNVTMARDASGVPSIAAITAEYTAAVLTPHLWYDASDTSTITDTSGAVDSIRDKRTGETLSASGSIRPTTGTRTINSLNVLDFDGADDRLTGAVSNIGSPAPAFHQFVVCQLDSGGLGGSADFITAYWDTAGAKAGKILALQVENDALTGTEPIMSSFATPLESNITGSAGATLLINYSIAASTNLSNGVFRIDGTDASETGGAASNLSFDGGTANFDIGAGSGAFNHFNGMFAETIVFDSVLSAEDAQKVEGYLAHKWGIEANLPAGHPYKSNPPVGDAMRILTSSGTPSIAATTATGTVTMARDASGTPAVAAATAAGSATVSSGTPTIDNEDGTTWQNEDGTNWEWEA